jgi:hypothetical protein
VKNFAIILLLLLAVAATAQDDDDAPARLPKPLVMKPTDQPPGAPFACPYEKDFRSPKKVGTYTLRLLPILEAKHDKDDADNAGAPRCRAVLTSPAGKKTTIAEDWALTLDKISGIDLNGDHKPELVIEGYSGGVHCCYTYRVISVGATPQLLHSFQNQVPITFEKQPDGAVLIRAADGVFDYFLIPHNYAVIPKVVLKIEGNKLVDVSSNFSETYDKEIELARSQLSTADLDKLRQSKFNDKMFTDQVATVHNVLAIVLNYLYSGREEKAWETLNDLWPQSDRSRAKSLILERRGRGLLANLNCVCRPALVVRRPTPKKPKPVPDETTDPRIRDIIED